MSDFLSAASVGHVSQSAPSPAPVSTETFPPRSPWSHFQLHFWSRTLTSSSSRSPSTAASAQLRQRPSSRRQRTWSGERLQRKSLLAKHCIRRLWMCINRKHTGLFPLLGCFEVKFQVTSTVPWLVCLTVSNPGGCQCTALTARESTWTGISLSLSAPRVKAVILTRATSSTPGASFQSMCPPSLS